MNLPSLPTDNLYKFQALAGSFVAILFIYLTERAVNDFSMQIIEAEESQAIAEVRLNHFERRADQLSKLIDNSIAVQRGDRVENAEKLRLNYSNREIKTFVREIENLALEREIESEKTRYSAARVRELKARLEHLWKWGLLLIGVGMLLAAAGFIQWYYKAQRPQDILIKHQMTNLALPTKTGEEAGDASAE